MLIARPAFITYIITGLFTTSFTTSFTTIYIARPAFITHIITVYALSLVVGVAEIILSRRVCSRKKNLRASPRSTILREFKN